MSKKNPKKPSDIHFVFFGTDHIAVNVLHALQGAGFAPSLIVTAPDAPVGRTRELTPTPVKKWALSQGIDIAESKTPRDQTFIEELRNSEWDLFIVTSYGYIIPKVLLEIPKHGVLNMHPSLLPKLRGPSPIRSAILNDMRKTGITIMLLDEEMDHGPILAQGSVEFSPEDWPPRAAILEDILSTEGGKLLADTIIPYLGAEITPTPQNHRDATYCKKFKKEDGEINLDTDPYRNFLKIRAFEGWPGTYFYELKNASQIRVKITDADFVESKLKILRVIPEGKREMDYNTFLLSRTNAR